MRPTVPSNVEGCPSCLSAVRRSFLVTDITILLDAIPTRAGTYVFDGVDGLIYEDRRNVLRVPKYSRHRCAKKTRK